MAPAFLPPRPMLGEGGWGVRAKAAAMDVSRELKVTLAYLLTRSGGCLVFPLAAGMSTEECRQKR